MSKIFATIGSGFFKGKRLELPSLGTTRSTKSILKGSFFDIFRFDLQGAIFIECFGGSGSMAAEALSNGAKFAIAIEKDRDAFKILRENFDCLNADLQKKFNQQNKSELHAINGDTFEILEQILEEIYAKFDEKINNTARKNLAFNSASILASNLTQNPSQKPNLPTIFLYIDPPFHIREGQEKIYEKTLNLIKIAEKFEIDFIAIEHISSVKFDEISSNFERKKCKKFGLSTLSIFQRIKNGN